MDFHDTPADPPRPDAHDGRRRRVGVEIEFAAVSAREGANIVKSLFGGSIDEEDTHRFHIRGTEFGDFVCELDMQYAHDALGKDGDERADEPAFLSRFRGEMRKFFGDVGSLVVPYEIACPPIDYTDLPRLDELLRKLIEAGAEGTRSSPFYAFGAQLNPEIADTDPHHLVSMLKAYLLVSPWLREVMSLDFTRRLFAFADPFPDAYVRKVLADDYWPDLETFMTDYMAANPTRNRELDLLPLFAWFDKDLVRRRIDDHRIKARPTFHYRLPDANIGEDDWNIVLEWNRWLVVEKLAEDPDLMARMAKAYRRSSRHFNNRWPLECSQYLVLS